LVKNRTVYGNACFYKREQLFAPVILKKCNENNNSDKCAHHKQAHTDLFIQKEKNMKTKLIAGSIISLLLLSGSCMKDDDDGNLSSGDRDFMRQAAYSNLAEVDAGTLASDKGTATRAFGHMMMMEHQAAHNELMSLAGKQSVDLPQGPDSAHIALKNQLSLMPSALFDSAYIHSQVQDHEAAVSLFRKEINEGKNEDVKEYANKYLPKIQMHLQMADSIKTSIQKEKVQKQ
jgi:putative membrane protein